MSSGKNRLPDEVRYPMVIGFFAVLFGSALIGIWSIFAPLSTTIRATGSLISSSPSYDIQHPYGGAIKKVFVTFQDSVEIGQPLVEFDVELQKQTLKEIKLLHNDLTRENRMIAQNVFEAEVATKVSTSQDYIQLKYQELRLKLDQDLAGKDEVILSNQSKVSSIQRGIEILRHRLERAEESAQVLVKLQTKGAVSKTEAEKGYDYILSLKGELNAQSAQLITIKAETETATLDKDRIKTQYRLNLLETYNHNISRLAELRGQIASLHAEVDASIIRSQIQGSVVSLNFDTDQMFVSRGETVLKLSRRLENPKVLMNISTQSIDQVYVGMVGKLTIPSLSQRNLPQINVKLVSLSPDASKDENNQPIGYRATGMIASADLVKISDALSGQLNLSTDMPVNVSIEGRKITPFNYFVRPFFSIFSQAIED